MKIKRTLTLNLESEYDQVQLGLRSKDEDKDNFNLESKYYGIRVGLNHGYIDGIRIGFNLVQSQDQSRISSGIEMGFKQDLTWFRIRIRVGLNFVQSWDYSRT